MRGNEILKLIMDLMIVIDAFLLIGSLSMFYMALNPQKGVALAKRKLDKRIKCLGFESNLNETPSALTRCRQHYFTYGLILAVLSIALWFVLALG